MLNGCSLLPVSARIQNFLNLGELLDVRQACKAVKTGVDTLCLASIPQIKAAVNPLEAQQTANTLRLLPITHRHHTARLVSSTQLLELLRRPNPNAALLACQLIRFNHIQSSEDLQVEMLQAAGSQSLSLSEAAIAAIFQTPSHHPLRTQLFNELEQAPSQHKWRVVGGLLCDELIHKPGSLATLVQLMDSGSIPLEYGQQIREPLAEYLEFGIQNAPNRLIETAESAHSNNVDLLIQKVSEQTFPIIFRSDLLLALMIGLKDDHRVHDLIAEILSAPDLHQNLLAVYGDLNTLQTLVIDYCNQISLEGAQLLCERMPNLISDAMGWMNRSWDPDEIQFKLFAIHLLGSQLLSQAESESTQAVLSYVQASIGTGAFNSLQQALGDFPEFESQFVGLGEQMIKLLAFSSEYQSDCLIKLMQVVCTPEYPDTWKALSLSILAEASEDMEIAQEFLIQFARTAPQEGSPLLLEVESLFTAPTPLQERAFAYFQQELNREGTPEETKILALNKCVDLLTDLNQKARVLITQVIDSTQTPNLRWAATERLVKELAHITDLPSKELASQAWIKQIKRQSRDQVNEFTDRLMISVFSQLRCWDPDLLEALKPNQTQSNPPQLNQPDDRRIRILEGLVRCTQIPPLFVKRFRSMALDAGEANMVRSLAWRALLSSSSDLSQKMELWSLAEGFRPLAFADMDLELSKLINR